MTPLRHRIEDRLLAAWAALAGLALWLPALGVPLGRILMQPMDLLVIAGLPLIPTFWRQFTGPAFWVLMPLPASLCLGWFAVGGQLLVLLWTLLFALPFLALMTLAFKRRLARTVLLKSLILGAGLSALLFLAQIAFGADRLDFRTNTAFSLPPQYGRGFALFPEVSTFATHAIMALGLGLALVMHPLTAPRLRRRALARVRALLVARLFSRSTSVIVLAPLLGGAAVVVTSRPTLNTLLMTMGLALVGAVILSLFLQAFYVDRLASHAAERSAAMRLASILGGLSPLISGEIFGMGLGENDAVRLRAHEAARALGRCFGNLPVGINSQVVSRLFEEGWPAALHLGLGAALLLKARRRARMSPETAALFVFAVGSALAALLVTGYRGIYTNWVWLAAAAALAPAQRRTADPRPGPEGQPCAAM